jgi:hypothetical protein
MMIIKNTTMKKDKNKSPQVSEAAMQTGIPTKKQDAEPEHKHQPPVKNSSTDGRRNTAEESSGLNEDKTSREDLLPLD